MLNDGASPNASDHQTGKILRSCSSDTPVLFAACERKFGDIVALLLNRGADPNSQLFRYSKQMKETIPSLLAAFPSSLLVEQLLKAGANPNKGHEQYADAYWEHSPLALAPTQAIEDLLRRYGARPKGGHR